MKRVTLGEEYRLLLSMLPLPPAALSNISLALQGWDTYSRAIGADCMCTNHE